MIVEATRTAKDRLILALDTDDRDHAMRLIDELHEYVGVFKVGLQLFANAGPDLLTSLREQRIEVFFDGKFLDIPNTVAGATEAVVSRGVFMFNVHATGGERMLTAAVEAGRRAAARSGLAPPIALAVTILTSLGEADLSQMLGVIGTVEEHVLRLATLARDCKLDGVVASCAEVPGLRAALGPDFILVTPGIRPSWSTTDDQLRIVTPAQAMRVGADYIVVGRPITSAENRRDAARRVLAEMEEGL